MAALSEQIRTAPHIRLIYFCSPISDRGATSPEIALLAEEWDVPGPRHRSARARAKRFADSQA